MLLFLCFVETQPLVHNLTHGIIRLADLHPVVILGRRNAIATSFRGCSDIVSRVVVFLLDIRIVCWRFLLLWCYCLEGCDPLETNLLDKQRNIHGIIFAAFLASSVARSPTSKMVKATTFLTLGDRTTLAINGSNLAFSTQIISLVPV